MHKIKRRGTEAPRAILGVQQGQGLGAGEILTVVNMEQRRAEQWVAVLVSLESVSVENPAEAMSGMSQEKNTNKFSSTELMQQAQNYSLFLHQGSLWHHLPKRPLTRSAPGSPRCATVASGACSATSGRIRITSLATSTRGACVRWLQGMHRSERACPDAGAKTAQVSGVAC